VILTGASSGIGWALAEVLAEEGAKLALAARSEAKLQELEKRIRQKGGEAWAIPTDVTRADDRHHLIQEALEKLKGLDGLVLNAGVGARGWFAEGGEKRLRTLFEVNFFGATELARNAFPHLQKGHHPFLLVLSSILGRRGVPGYVEYCASKFALSGWAEALRAEWAPWGIHVLLASPGGVATPFREHLLENRLPSQSEGSSGVDPQRFARKLVRALRKRRHEVFLTPDARFLIGLNRLAPRLSNFLMRRYATFLLQAQKSSNHA